MKRAATVYELLGTIIGIIAAVYMIMMSYVNRIEDTAKKTENHEVRIAQVEKENREFKQEYKQDMRDVKEALQKIAIAMENKEDRK